MEKFFREYWKVILIAFVSLIVGFVLNYIANCVSDDKLFDKIKAEIAGIKQEIKTKQQL